MQPGGTFEVGDWVVFVTGGLVGRVTGLPRYAYDGYRVRWVRERGRPVVFDGKPPGRLLEPYTAVTEEDIYAWGLAELSA